MDVVVNIPDHEGKSSFDLVRRPVAQKLRRQFRDLPVRRKIGDQVIVDLVEHGVGNDRAPHVPEPMGLPFLFWLGCNGDCRDVVTADTVL